MMNLAPAPTTLAIMQQAQAVKPSRVLSLIPGYAKAIADVASSGREVPVALLLNRGLNLSAAEFSVLHLKRFFLPIDPANPVDRIESILQDSAAEVLVVDRSTRELGSKLSCAKVVDLSKIQPDMDAATPVNLDDAIKLSDNELAYLIYTSGSTGQPKGVPVHWSALDNHNQWFIKEFELSPDDRCTQLMSEGFDVSIQDVFPVLRSGATLYPASKRLLSDPFSFIQWIETNQITVLSLPTALWHTLVPLIAQEGLPKTVRLVLVGGEPVNPQFVEQWFSQIDERQVRLVNMYGPSEVTIASTFCDLSSRQLRGIGKPIDNIEATLLNAAGEAITETEVNGELVLGGAGVVTGYWNRPEQTALAFFDSDATGKRYYRTGDLACYDENRELLFVGRKDSQVKLRGFRIELNEIALAVSSHPRVEKAVVRKVSTAQQREYLACFAVLVANPETTPSETVPDSDEEFETELRQHVKEKLPEYMVPTVFQFISHFPVTVGGKIDHQQLLQSLQLESSDLVVSQSADESDIVQRVCKVWKEVLGDNPDSLNATFADSGGDSLAAMRFVLRLHQEFDLRGVGLATLAIWNTVESLAAQLGELKLNAPRVVSSNSLEPAVTHLKSPAGKGSLPSLVLFHPAGGCCHQYHELLSDEVRDNFSVVFVESPFLSREIPHDKQPTVAQIAKEYFQAIVRYLPADQEVVVGGYSFGAILAWECAQLLRQDNFQVKRVINIDQPVPTAIVRHCGVAKRLGNWMVRMKYPGSTLKEFKRLRKLNRARAVFRKCSSESSLSCDLAHLACLEDFYIGIEKGYTPEYTPEYADLELILIRSELLQARFEFPELYGWSRFSNSIQVVHVPGTHGTLFNDSFVGKLREVFSSSLRRAAKLDPVEALRHE